MRRYINLFVPHRTWLYILFSTDLICYLLIQKTSIYLESLENNSNKNGDDDDNNNDNNDTNKTVQLVKSTIQPTKRESRRAAHVLAEKTMWKKIQQKQLLSTRRVQDSPWFRWADAWKNQRTVKHAESVVFLGKVSMKTMAPGTWTECCKTHFILEWENKTVPMTKRSPLSGPATVPIHSKNSIQCNR